MENLTCQMTFNNQNNLVVFTGLSNTALQLDYSGDIDFTPLVDQLMQLIDGGSKIILSEVDKSSFTDKEILVEDTIRQIFHNFNSSIIQNESTPEENVGIESTNDKVVPI